MKIIAAVDENWGIGKNGDLLEKIPEDQKFFKEITSGKVVVYGRKTLESLPGKRPLKDRINIILSTNKEYTVENGIVIHSVEELLQYLINFNSDNVFVIGGGTIYKQLLRYCDTAYITKICESYDADVWFPNLDKSYTDWNRCTNSTKICGNHVVQFIEYTRMGKTNKNEDIIYSRKVNSNDMHVEERQFFKYVCKQINYVKTKDPVNVLFKEKFYEIFESFSIQNNISKKILLTYVKKWEKIGFLEREKYCTYFGTLTFNLYKMPLRYLCLFPNRVISKLQRISNINCINLALVKKSNNK